MHPVPVRITDYDLYYTDVLCTLQFTAYGFSFYGHSTLIFIFNFSTVMYNFDSGVRINSNLFLTPKFVVIVLYDQQLLPVGYFLIFKPEPLVVT